MDPTNYESPFHPDPYIHGPPLDWRREPGHHPPIPPSSWAPNYTSAPPIYPMQRSYPMGFDSQHQMGLSGGLPLPGPTPRGYPLPYPHPAPLTHARAWTDIFPQMPAPIPPNHVGMMPVPARPAYGLPSSVATSESELALSGVSSESGAQPRGIYTPQQHPGIPMGQFPGSLATPLQNTPMPLGRRSNYHALPGTPSRTSRAPLSSPPYGSLPHHHDLSGPPPHAHRRSGHSRARRSISTRLTASDSSRDTEESSTHDARSDQMASQSAVDNATRPTTQQMPVTSDVMPEKMASRIALCVLQKISIQDLPENERTCVICYNDYGAETPEGINEVPLRLPKCKHVFGDHCITRWFEESDSCPYCRDKLDLPSRHCFDRGASQAFMAMMRARSQLPPGATDEMYLRLMSNLVHDEDFAESRELRVPERRSYHANGDSGSSSPNSEIAASASSSTATSPIRSPPRDTARYSQWLPRPSQQRGAHPPLSQERETSRHRRQRFSRGNNPPGPNADGDSSNLRLSPLQTLGPDGPAQPSTAIPSANAEDSERLRNLTDVQQALNASVVSMIQDRSNRPW